MVSAVPTQALTLGSRSDIAPSDIGKDNVGVGVLRLNVGRTALSAAAGPVGTGVEPSHLLRRIVPDAHGQHH